MNVFGMLVEIERCEIKPLFEEMETEFKKSRHTKQTRNSSSQRPFPFFLPSLSSYAFVLFVPNGEGKERFTRCGELHKVHTYGLDDPNSCPQSQSNKLSDIKHLRLSSGQPCQWKLGTGCIGEQVCASGCRRKVRNARRRLKFRWICY